MFHAKLVYDKKSVCQSRVVDDFERVVNLDENGDEYITFEKVDYPKIQQSLGDFKMWSLNSLIAAGIDPDFGIRTCFNTRLEGASVVESAVGQILGAVDDDIKNDKVE